MLGVMLVPQTNPPACSAELTGAMSSAQRFSSFVPLLFKTWIATR